MLESDDMYKPFIGARMISDAAALEATRIDKVLSQRNDLLSNLQSDLIALRVRRIWDQFETEVFISEEQYDEANNS